MAAPEILDKVTPEIKSALHSLYSSPAWQYQEALANEMIESIRNELCSVTDPITLYRAQGKIEGIRLLLGFKDTLFPKQTRRQY